MSGRIISIPTMSMKAATIRTTSLASDDDDVGPAVLLMEALSDHHRRDACGEEACDAAAEQGLHAELRQRGALVGRERADPTDLDSNRGNVGKSAQRVCQDDLGTYICECAGLLHLGESAVRIELIQNRLLADDLTRDHQL